MCNFRCRIINYVFCFVFVVRIYVSVYEFTGLISGVVPTRFFLEGGRHFCGSATGHKLPNRLIVMLATTFVVITKPTVFDATDRRMKGRVPVVR